MFYENLEAILKERNCTINQFAKEIGIKQQTIANWKTRSAPSADYVKQIAEHLHISADYLLDIEVQHESELTASEEQLVTYYRKADDRGKDLLLSLAKQEADRTKETERSSKSAKAV